MLTPHRITGDQAQEFANLWWSYIGSRFRLAIMRAIKAPDIIIREGNFEKSFQRDTENLVRFLAYNQHPVTTEEHTAECALWNEVGIYYSPEEVFSMMQEEQNQAIVLLRAMLDLPNK